MTGLDVLIGLWLCIIRHAADMLVLQFGTVRPHRSGRGTVGDYALHIQCPWRFDAPGGTVTGRSDLWEYAGPGERPTNWTYDSGSNQQDEKLTSIFGPKHPELGWSGIERFAVVSVSQSGAGDVTIMLTEGYSFSLFPDSACTEAWRFFKPGGGDHMVFPTEETIH